MIKILSRTEVLKPNEMTQRDALCGAIVEILWKAGERKSAVLVLPDVNPVLEPSVRLSADDLTEKVLRQNVKA